VLLQRIKELEAENHQMRETRSMVDVLREEAVRIIDAVLMLHGGSLSLCELLRHALKRAEQDEARRHEALGIEITALKAQNAALAAKVAALESAAETVRLAPEKAVERASLKSVTLPTEAPKGAALAPSTPSSHQLPASGLSVREWLDEVHGGSFSMFHASTLDCMPAALCPMAAPCPLVDVRFVAHTNFCGAASAPSPGRGLP
jgi:hypothetical protein